MCTAFSKVLEFSKAEYCLVSLAKHVLYIEVVISYVNTAFGPMNLLNLLKVQDCFVKFTRPL